MNAAATVTLCGVGDYPLEVKPEMARLAMRLISAWATLESHIVGIFVAVLGSEAKIGVAIYDALARSSLRTDAFLSAANVKLASQPHRIELLGKIVRMRNDRSFGLIRNLLAHSRIGTAPELPDSILVAESAAVVQYMIANDIHEFGAVGQRPTLDPESVYVIGSDDLESAIAKVESLASVCRHYRALFSPRLSGRSITAIYAFIATHPGFEPVPPARARRARGVKGARKRGAVRQP